MAYNGVIAPIIAGRGGFNGSENFDAIPYTDLLQAQNIRFDGNAWRKVGGLALLDSNAVTGTPNCLAGLDYWVDATTQRQITVWSNGICYKELTGNLDAVELANSLVVSNAPPVLITCGQESAGNNRKALFFSQGQTPQFLDGDANTFTAMTNLALDWSGSNMPMGGIIHDRRVYAFGNPNAKHTIYASALDDHANFKRYNPTDATSDILPSFDCNPGEGEEIRALHSIGSTRLYIFKFPVGIYWANTQYITSYSTPITTVRTDLGIAGPNAITKVGTLGTWFIGADAHLYNLEMISNPDVDLQDASITAKMYLSQWLQDNVNFARLKHARLVWDSNRKELTAYYTATNGTLNNLALVIDLHDPSNPRVATETRGDYFNAAWFRRNTSNFSELIVSGTGGLAYKANQRTRRIASATGYEARLRTSDTDFAWMNQAYAAYTKRFDWLEIIYNSTNSASVFIDIFIDGQYYNTYSTSMGSASAPLGSFVLGTSRLAISGQAHAKIKIGGIGKRFGCRLRNSAANSDFSISRLLVYFVPQETEGETA